MTGHTYVTNGIILGHAFRRVPCDRDRDRNLRDGSIKRTGQYHDDDNSFIFKPIKEEFCI